MTAHDAFLKHLAAADFDAIEDAWLAQLDERPDDLDYFTTVADALVKSGEGERARFLLGMLDEHLTTSGAWPTRLTLLRQAGPHLVDAAELHTTILATLGEIHGEHSRYEQMVDKVGLHRATDDLPKTWQKIERLASLLVLDVGTIVRMEGKGAGRILEVNLALESFRVEFEHHGSLMVRFHGAAKLLEPLPPDHVLRRKTEAPGTLERLRDEDPSELLRLVLTSYDRPRTSAEIKSDLLGIVSEARWTSFWNTARKHPQVLTAAGGRHSYSWAASSEDAQGAVWKAFTLADPAGKIDLLRRNGERDPELRARMAKSLAKLAAEAAETQPGLACEIWFQLERSGELPGDVAWSPLAQVRERRDLAPLLAGVGDRQLRERIYALVRQERNDWVEVFVQSLWQETDPRSLDLLANELLAAAASEFERIFDQLLSQPRKSPEGFVWLSERAADNPAWLERNPLRLLKQILWVASDEAFTGLRPRLVPLFESGGTLPRLLAYFDLDQAAQAIAALDKAPGLAKYEKQPLITALQLKYPALREETEAPLYATHASITAKRAELKELVEVEIPTNRRAIEEARELGDLRENFEYKSARQRHEYLSSRAASLNHDLSRARPIDPSQVSGEEVVIGAVVHLERAGSPGRKITLLGPWESKPEEDVLSNESEAARELLGHKLGETVVLGGEELKIAAIAPYGEG